MDLFPLISANGKCVGAVRCVFYPVEGAWALYRLTTGPTYLLSEQPHWCGIALHLNETTPLSAVDAVEMLRQRGGMLGAIESFYSIANAGRCHNRLR